MRPPHSLTACTALLWTLLAAGLPAAEPTFEFEDFALHQYVGSRGFSPASVIELDTNGEVLIACREPRTREELAALGVEALESQLVLLRAMRMLALEDGKLKTQVPFLAGAAAVRLRAAAAALVPELVEALRADVEALGRELTELGYGNHRYAVVFSYVLDGMVWDSFEEYGEVRPRRLSAASPHWAGEVWAIHPPRPAAAGTSTIVVGDLAWKIGRTPGGDEALAPLLAGWRDLRDVLRRYAAGEELADPALARQLAGYGLVDDGGQLAVPIVVQRTGEEIFERAQRMTEKVTARVLELDLAELGAALGLRDREQTLILAYHELMWDLMDALEAAGLAPRPAVLRGDAAAGPRDAAVVAFVVDRRRQAAATGKDEEEVDDEE